MCDVGSSRFDIGGRGSYPYMVVLIFCVVVAVSYLLYALRVYTRCAWAGGTFLHCLRKVPPAHSRFACLVQELGW